jgi:TrkA domain protein
VGQDGRVEINETVLPGVGVRYELTTRAGVRLCVVARRDQRMELLVFDRDDPDMGREVAVMTEAEATALGEILGAPRLTEQLADLNREVPGLASGRIEVQSTSRYVGGTLGDTRARTRTGASIVALVRGTDVIASPTPSQPLLAGDVLVVIGTAEAIDGVRAIIDRD